MNDPTPVRMEYHRARHSNATSKQTSKNNRNKTHQSSGTQEKQVWIIRETMCSNPGNPIGTPVAGLEMSVFEQMEIPARN